MDAPLILSLFPGIGMLDMAFEEEGFCLVRGPDLLWGGDIKTFHPPAGKFDGVIGGPPCQAFSRLAHIVRANGYALAPNLIPEFERCVGEADPTWFLMENVEAAPIPAVDGYTVKDSIVRDVWVGGLTERKRRFSFGTRGGEQKLDIEWLALHSSDPEHSVMAHGGNRPVPVVLIRDKHGGHRSKKSALKNYGYSTASAYVDALRKQGLPPDFLTKAPFTIAGKCLVVGNGVPLPMGRAIAKAVKRALQSHVSVP